MHAGSLQIRRLTSSGGNCTVDRAHPLGNINQFHRLLPVPKILNLTRHETAESRVKLTGKYSQRPSVEHVDYPINWLGSATGPVLLFMLTLG